MVYWFCMVTLYLVRHGQARGNAQHLHLGWTNMDLTLEGYTNAKRASEFLNGRPVHRIISSDLVRARMTAQTIAEAYELSVDTTTDLRERGFGALEMTPIWHLNNFDISELLSEERCGAANVEYMGLFTQRIERMYARLLSVATDGPLAVVTHYGVIRQIFVASGIVNQEGRNHFHPSNGAVYILEVDSTGARVVDRSSNAIMTLP